MRDCSHAASYTPGEKENQKGHKQLLGGSPESLRELKAALQGDWGWHLFQKVTSPPLPRKLKQVMVIPDLCTAMAEHSLQSSGSCKLHRSYQKAKVKVCFADQSCLDHVIGWGDPYLSWHHHGSRTQPGAGAGLAALKCYVLSAEQSLKHGKLIIFVSD